MRGVLFRIAKVHPVAQRRVDEGDRAVLAGEEDADRRVIDKPAELAEPLRKRRFMLHPRRNVGHLPEADRIARAGLALPPDGLHGRPEPPPRPRSADGLELFMRGLAPRAARISRKNGSDPPNWRTSADSTLNGEMSEAPTSWR